MCYHFSASIFSEELGLKTEVHKYRCSKCEFESRSRRDVENHMLLAKPDHSEAVVEVLLGKEARGKTCPMCDVRLQESQLFKVYLDTGISGIYCPHVKGVHLSPVAIGLR